MSQAMTGKVEVKKVSAAQAWLMAGLVLAMMLGGAGILEVVRQRWNVMIVKPPAPLPKGTLVVLPKKIGPYEAVGVDRKLAPDIAESLGTEQYLLRDYRDTRKREGEAGYVVSLNMNYYATGSASPHVPEICWAANGMQPYDKGFFTIQGIRHKGGETSDMRVRLLSFMARPKDQMDGALMAEAEAGANRAKLLNVGYVFQVNQGYGASAQEVRKHFWDPKAKYAYHTKIELTVPGECSPEEAQPVIEGFLREALGAIEEILPDAASLAAAEKEQDNAKGSGGETRPAEVKQP